MGECHKITVNCHGLLKVFRLNGRCIGSQLMEDIKIYKKNVVTLL